jgi:hypothetical protein
MAGLLISARIATRKKRQRISPKPMQLAHSVAGCVIKRYTYPLFPRLPAKGRDGQKNQSRLELTAPAPFDFVQLLFSRGRLFRNEKLASVVEPGLSGP